MTLEPSIAIYLKALLIIKVTYLIVENWKVENKITPVI